MNGINMNKTELLEQASQILEDVSKTTDDRNLSACCQQWLSHSELKGEEELMLMVASQIMTFILKYTTIPELKPMYKDWLSAYEEIKDDD